MIGLTGDRQENEGDRMMKDMIRVWDAFWMEEDGMGVVEII